MSGCLTPDEVEARITARNAVEWVAYFKEKVRRQKEAEDALKHQR
jgi:hypothetical protein